MSEYRYFNDPPPVTTRTVTLPDHVWALIEGDTRVTGLSPDVVLSSLVQAGWSLQGQHNYASQMAGKQTYLGPLDANAAAALAPYTRRTTR